MTEEKIVKTTRFEVGFFVRKVVDGRVVRQWQFPPQKRRPVAAVPSPPAPKAGPGDETEPMPKARAFALEAAAPEGDQSTAGSSGGSTDGSSTTYEAGVFFRTETVSPPEYPPEPIKG